MTGDPQLEQRRKTGNIIIGVAVGGGCLGFILLMALFLAIWQFLSPADRPVPSHAPRTTAPVST